ncbi:11930_t:CDS:2, partial [Ambispora leptoticha]
PNILYQETDESINVVLIDFDWAGEAGKVSYPSFLNIRSVKRHSDARSDKDYPYMKYYSYNGSSEYKKAMRFLEIGCNCGCSKMIPREKFAELREAFQALYRSEQDLFLMAQLQAMNGGEITTSRRLKKKTRIGRTSKTPGRNVNRITQSLTLLPAETSYKSVYRDFIAGLENDSTLKLLKYGAFRKLWHQLTLYIQIMSPRTDLCDTCQHFRNGLQYNARKEEEAKELLKKYKEHLVKAKLERNYCNKNEISRTTEKIAQNVHVPHSDQQASKIYYLSPRKVHLFGVQDEAAREQINYNEIIGKALMAR